VVLTFWTKEARRGTRAIPLRTAVFGPPRNGMDLNPISFAP
jgi:hypothetical protein